VNVDNNLERGTVTEPTSSVLGITSSSVSINLSDSPKVTNQPPVEAIGDQTVEELNYKDKVLSSQISVEAVFTSCDNSDSQSVKL